MCSHLPTRAGSFRRDKWRRCDRCRHAICARHSRFLCATQWILVHSDTTRTPIPVLMPVPAADSTSRRLGPRRTGQARFIDQQAIRRRHPIGRSYNRPNSIVTIRKSFVLLAGQGVSIGMLAVGSRKARSAPVSSLSYRGSRNISRQGMKAGRANS